MVHFNLVSLQKDKWKITNPLYFALPIYQPSSAIITCIYPNQMTYAKFKSMNYSEVDAAFLQCFDARKYFTCMENITA